MLRRAQLLAALMVVAVVASACGIKMLGPRNESRFDPKYQEEVIFTWKREPGNTYNVIIIDPTEEVFKYEAGEAGSYSLAIGKMKQGIYRWYVERVSLEDGKVKRSAERRVEIR
jgi:hypothetical protein